MQKKVVFFFHVAWELGYLGSDILLCELADLLC